MLVEDDSLDVQDIARQLPHLGDYELHVETTAEDALRWLGKRESENGPTNEERVWFTLCDWGMPGNGGSFVARRPPELRTVVLTLDLPPDARRVAYRHNVLGVIRKPVSGGRMREVLETILAYMDLCE